MASVPTTPPRMNRSFFRFWFPWIVICLAAAAIAVIAMSPLTEEWAPVNRVVASTFAGILAGVFLLFWFLFFSGVRWSVRLLVLFALAATGFAFAKQVRQVKFTGDMVPVVRFWWDPDPDELVEDR